MDLSALIEFFSQRPFLNLDAPIYASFFIARVIHGVLKQIDFDASRIKELLVKTGHRLKNEILQQLAMQAQKGVDALADWLRSHLDELEVNETATEIVVSQTIQAGQALDQATSEEVQRTAVAKQVGEGLKQVGGAAGTIADQFAEALQNPAQREELAKLLAGQLDAWFKQSQIARRNSLIRDSAQRAEGIARGDQTQEATDESKIIGSSQTIIGPKTKPTPDK